MSHGKRERVALTEARVRDLAPAAKVRSVSDAEVVGLHVRVMPSGSKTWNLYVHPVGGKRHRVSLGRWPEVSCRQARVAARGHLSAAAAGRDVAAEVAATRDGHDLDEIRRQFEARGERIPSYAELLAAAVAPEPEREFPPYRELVAAYVEDKGARWRANTRRDYEALQEHHLLPGLGELRTDAITFKRASALFRKITAEAGPRQANKAISLLTTHLRWATRDPDTWGVVVNHAALVTRHADKRRRVIVAADDLARLGQAIVAADAPPVVKAAFRFLLLAPLRHQEALALRWEDLHPDEGYMVVQESKRDTPHRPLSSHAWATIADLPRTDAGWLFPSPREPAKRVYSLTPWWPAIRDAAKLGDLRIHDFRHLAGGRLNDLGEDRLTIGAVLGHASEQSAGRYVNVRGRAAVAAEALGASMVAALEGRGWDAKTKPKAKRSRKGAK